MIVEYHRPQTIEAALELLGRPEPLTLPLGGGTVLNRPSSLQFAAVDLQGLGLNTLNRRGNYLDVGAGVSLQTLSEVPELPMALSRAIRGEATYNLRQVATVAGSLVAAGGRSTFAAAMLALDATLLVAPGDETLELGSLLPLRPGRLTGRLITRVTLPLNVRLAYEVVARTPDDLPIVCVAAAAWHSGRTRVALGGFGAAPRLAFDGSEAAGAEIAARSAYELAGDEWASAEYRSEIAAKLTVRAIQQLGQELE